MLTSNTKVRKKLKYEEDRRRRTQHIQPASACSVSFKSHAKTCVENLRELSPDMTTIPTQLASFGQKHLSALQSRVLCLRGCRAFKRQMDYVESSVATGGKAVVNYDNHKWAHIWTVIFITFFFQ